MEDGAGVRLAQPGPLAGRARAMLDTSRPLLPAFTLEIALLERCLASYADILQGKQDPIGVLFPNGDLGMLEAIYRDSPLARATGVQMA